MKGLIGVVCGPVFGIVIGAVLFALAGEAQARDTKKMYSVDAAMQSATAAENFSDDIQFYFGEGNHPAVQTDFGNFQSNKKANGVGRSDEKVCERAFLSAMISLRDRARTEGGDAVINIVSNYKKNRISSTTQYECGSGAIMSGVTLRGDVVKLK